MTSIKTRVTTLLCLGLLLPMAAQSAQFSIVVIPDTQMYVEQHPEIFEAQMNWITANQVAEKIIYVAHLGDLKDDLSCDNKTVNVGTGGGRTEWQIVDDTLGILDAATVAYGVIPGNHDFDQVSGDCPNFTTERPLGTYNSLIGPTRFAGTAHYGDPSVPTPGNRVTGSNEDNFALFESDGVKFIAINLAYKEFANPIGMDPEVTWADNLLKAYPDRIGIVTSHYFMDANPGNSFGPYGQEIYDGLSNNPNLFMMLSAHEFGEAWRTDMSGRIGMQPVQALLSDYQRYVFPSNDGDPGTPPNDPNPAGIDFTNFGNTGFGDSGLMRIMRFDTVTGMVDIESFIPPVIPVKNRPGTLVSTYSPASGAGMAEDTASNIGFTYLGYAASAAFSFDIFECDGIAGGTCTTPSGSISFPSDSGLQTNGTDFNLTYSCTGTFCNGTGYDENDIVNVDWTIDAVTGEITALEMRLDTDPGCLTGTSPLPCSQTAVNFELISPGLTGNTASGGSCSDDGMGNPVCISGISTNGANLFDPN